MKKNGPKLLRGFMKRSKLSGSELARRLGVARSLVSQWLSGRRSPGRRNAIALEATSGGVVPASSWDDAPTPASPSPLQ